MEKKYLTVPETAKILNISSRSVYRFVAEGHFRCAKFGGSLRIKSNSLQEYIKNAEKKWSFENGHAK